MSEIGKLLEKLRPLDRNLYDNLKLMQAALGRMDLLCADDVFGDHVQGEVQRAIAATELHLLQSQYEDDGQYYAEISRIVPGYDGDCWNEKHLSLIAMGNGPSPCHALLACYIDCLERHA